jgi:hypothetical protein
MIGLLALLAFSPPHGRYLQIDGFAQGLMVPHSKTLMPAGDMTVEAWIKPLPNDRTGPYHFIVSKNYAGTGYALLLIGRGDDYRIQFEACDVLPYFISMRVLQGHWWHVAGVFRPAKSMELYLNGVRVAEKSTTNRILDNELPLRIGTSLWDSFTGSLDEVRVWDRALTQEQVLDSMKSSLSGQEPGLIACWSFDRLIKGKFYDKAHHTEPAQLIGKPLLRSR